MNLHGEIKKHFHTTFGEIRRRSKFETKVPGSCSEGLEMPSSLSSSSSSLSSRVLGTAFWSGRGSRTVLDFFFNMSEKCFVVLISRI